MSALFLAGKAEETRLKLGDVLPIFRSLWGGEPLVETSPIFSRVRDRVLFYEQLHLQVCGYCGYCGYCVVLRMSLQ